MIYKVPAKDIPCKHFTNGSDNQAPFGSGLYWPEHFEDCTSTDERVAEILDKDETTPLHDLCNTLCPGYEAIKLAVCAQHGEHFPNEPCGRCMEEEWEKDRRPEESAQFKEFRRKEGF